MREILAIVITLVGIIHTVTTTKTSTLPAMMIHLPEVRALPAQKLDIITKILIM